MIIKDENDLIEVYKIENNRDKDKALFNYFKDLKDYIRPSNPKILDMLKNGNSEGFFSEIMNDYLPNLTLSEYDGISIVKVKEI